MPIATGSLRSRIALQEFTQASDGAGGHTKSWRTVATCWANVRPAGGGDQREAGQVISRQRYEVRIRRRKGLHSGMRVTRGTQAFEIIAIPPNDDAPDELLLLVEDVPGAPS